MRAHEELFRTGEAVHCEVHGNNVRATVIVTDRPGLLTELAGAFTICGIDVVEAHLFGTTDGHTLDAFEAVDPFGHLVDDTDRLARTRSRARSPATSISMARSRRAAATPPRSGARRGPTNIEILSDVSETDTVVEVHADDDAGLLYRLAATFADLGLDVRVAKVATLGRRVVDVFYLRDASGAKLVDREAIDNLRSALTAGVER